jgi:hypothetical protein
MGLSLNSKIWIRDDGKPSADLAFRIVITIRWKVRFSEGFAEKQCQKPREHFALRLVDSLRHCFYLRGSTITFHLTGGL